MILTRYLYDKEQVEHSLFIALLNRDVERAKFWIYELYHSGFKQESFILVWRLYYQLYAGFFVNLEGLLKQQTLEWLDDNRRDWTIGTIVQNMARCETCIEFYRISRGEHTAPSGLSYWVDRIRAVRLGGLSSPLRPPCCDEGVRGNLGSLPGDYFKVFDEFVAKNGCFKVKGKKARASFRDTFERIKILPLEILKYACIARMFTGVFLLDSGNGFDKKVYIILQKKDVIAYRNKPFVQNKSWRILRRECKYPLDLSPDYCGSPVSESDWINHAYNSPIWRQRIEKYGGSLTSEGIVVFDNEENEEQFHVWYNMEIDEQPASVADNWKGVKTNLEKYACEPFNTWASTYTLKV